MIEVYAFSTPNSIKVPLALEEAGFEYALHRVNIRAGEQHDPAFVALNANAKVPVLVDPEGPDGRLVLTESAAILIYIAEKSGKLMPMRGTARARVFEQLLFHASALGPNFGNTGWARGADNAAALARFETEANRVTDLLEAKLGGARYIAGDELSIADIAHWSWFWRRAFVGISFDGRPNLTRWFDELAARPAFQRAEARVVALAPQ
jgi:glutathione S-transferase